MNRIKELRESKRMSQLHLGMELGVSQETISGYEIGRSYPSVDVLIKISNLFNASCDYILGLSDVKTIQNGGEYKADEIMLISDYRTLLPTERKMVGAYIQALKDRKQN